MPRAGFLSALLFFAIAALPARGAAAPDADGLLRFSASGSVAETMDRLAEVARARGFRIFARVDHAAGAASVGRNLRPTQLLVFGNPKGGAPLMEAAQTMAIDLPLKALVYEDAEGRVWIAFNDPAYLVRRHHLADSAPVVARMTALIEGLVAATVKAEGADTP